MTFVDWDELPRWSLIDKALGLGFGEPVETYSTSPNLYEDLGIPAGTTGRLPRGQRTRAGLEAEQVEDLGEVGAAKGRRPRKDSREDSRGGSRRPAPEAAEEGVVEERVERPRRDRQRRRTRNGVAVEATAGTAEQNGTTPVEAPADVPAQIPTEAPAGSGDAGERPRRRRRTRSASAAAGAETVPAPAAD